jgi:hypothetical protein
MGRHGDMKEQGAIGKTGHQQGYFSLGSGTGIGNSGKWFTEDMAHCEKYPFDLTPSPLFLPQQTFPLPLLIRAKHKAPHIRFRADTKNKVTMNMRATKH